MNRKKPKNAVKVKAKKTTQISRIVRSTKAIWVKRCRFVFGITTIKGIKEKIFEELNASISEEEISDILNDIYAEAASHIAEDAKAAKLIIDEMTTIIFESHTRRNLLWEQARRNQENFNSLYQEIKTGDDTRKQLMNLLKEQKSCAQNEPIPSQNKQPDNVVPLPGFENMQPITMGEKTFTADDILNLPQLTPGIYIQLEEIQKRARQCLADIREEEEHLTSELTKFGVVGDAARNLISQKGAHDLVTFEYLELFLKELSGIIETNIPNQKIRESLVQAITSKMEEINPQYQLKKLKNTKSPFHL